jgi:hypothetical protein
MSFGVVIVDVVGIKAEESQAMLLPGTRWWI